MPMPRALELNTQNIPAKTAPTAKSVPAPVKTAPVAPAASKPVITPATTKAPAKVSDYTLGDVITMQNMITSLSNTMVRNADSISASKGISKEEVINYATSFGNMGKKYSGQNDGVWGSNTNSVLQNINNFLFKIKSNLKVELGSGDYPFNGDQEELKKLAINNTNVIVKIFGELGINKPADQTNTNNKVNIGEYNEFDRVKQTLSMKDALDPNSYGDIIVLPKDLDHLGSFYLFIQGLHADWFTVCKPLDEYLSMASEKAITPVQAALEILNTSIYKLSQDATPEAPKPVSSEKDVETPESTGVCFSFLDGVLSWFMTRTRTIYNASKKDKDKLALAEKYQSAVHGLTADWIKIKPYIIKQIKAAGAENNPKITVEMFMMAGEEYTNNKGKSKAKGQLVDYNGGKETGVRQDTGRGQDKLIGPIQTTMDIESMISEEGYGKYFGPETLNIAAEIKKRSSNGVLPVLEAGEWSNSANWKYLASEYILAKTNVEAQNKFEEYANLINQFLYSALGDWLRHPYIVKNIPLDSKKAQRLILSNWSRYINNLIREARYDARNPEGTQQRKWTGAF